MKLLLVSPYHGGSHQAWGEGYSQTSNHEINLLTLPARFWKWRMHGAAVTLARRFMESRLEPDLILATDMLDLTTFLSLTRSTTHNMPAVLYVHENQLTYPLPADKTTGPMRRQLGERDRHYAFINYASMLAADEVWFNSAYHLESFFAALPDFLKHFPEYNELGTVHKLIKKSLIMPVGIDFGRLDEGRYEKRRAQNAQPNPLILWNQRWEYDKNPDTFFAALDVLAGEGISFRVAVCGQQFGRQPPAFEAGIKTLGERVYHAGFADSATYARLLWESDVTVSTAHHEFFGISILEAIYANTFPVLPARLSYPELIPVEYHGTCLYDNFESLVNILRTALLNNNKSRRTAAALSSATAVYDWTNIASRYDARLTELQRAGDSLIDLTRGGAKSGSRDSSR